MLIALLACGTSQPTIEVPGVKATVPSDTVPLHGAAKDGLVAGTLRQDPSADVRVEGVAPAGNDRNVLYAVMRMHRSPGAEGGMTVEEWTRANVDALLDHAKTRGLAVSHDETCADGVCVFQYTLGGVVQHRSQLSMEGGRLLTLSCQCSQDGCLDTCSIQAP